MINRPVEMNSVAADERGPIRANFQQSRATDPTFGLQCPLIVWLCRFLLGSGLEIWREAPPAQNQLSGHRGLPR